MQLSKIPLSLQMLVALLAGILLGAITSKVFFGVNAIANAFVLLLQMTALPYVSLSLIVGIGSLSPLQASTALKRSLLVILGLISVTLVFILLAPIAFPDWENASFYSANTGKISESTDLISLFIPANPFYAFANAIIPAVVIFSIFIGIGLMSVSAKRQTLTTLGALQKATVNVSNLVMRFAPLGVFCIGVRAAATINPDQTDGLLVYLVTTICVVSLISFALLPACVACFTPFSYREILISSRAAMVTAFATGSFFVVIPIIVEKVKVLLAIHNLAKDDAYKIPDVIIPISFSLPIGGKLLALLFTLFAAWFSGAYVSLIDYTNLISSGVPQLFGTTTLAMPTLLELLNVSSTMFDIFILSENLIVGRLGALMSVISAVALSLLIAASITDKYTIKWRLFARYFVIIAMLSVSVLVVLRYSFETISHQYQGYSKFIERDFLFRGVEARYLDKPQNNGETVESTANVLDQIKQRGFIRVGYFIDDLPYSFHNHEGKLVGFDIEIMHQLAADLGVEIEFVRIFRKQTGPLLASGYLDITTGIPVIPDNMTEFTLSIPYSTQAIAFIVKAERRATFNNWQKIVNRKDLIIGVPEAFFYRDAIERKFVHAKAWEITTPRLFFRDDYRHIDAMLFGAAAASAWTLLYPDYTVVAPNPVLPPLSMAFPIHRNDQGFELFMRNWIEMKRQNKTLERLFNYWIGGQKKIT